MSTAIALSQHELPQIIRKAVRHRRNRDPRITPFLAAYALSGNGRKSALLVGCSEKSAATQANKWLKRSDVQAELSVLISQRAGQAKQSRLGVTEEWVLHKLKAVAEAEDARKADVIAASVAIGKHLNMFTDRKEVDAKITITVERIGG